jgi:hypothetical protein
MNDVERLTEPAALARHLTEVADTIAALELRADAGQDYDPVTWRAAVEGLETGRVSAASVAGDAETLDKIIALLDEAAGLVQTLSGGPASPADWRAGVDRIREAVALLRTLAS